jgi:hypothetical protein
MNLNMNTNPRNLKMPDYSDRYGGRFMKASHLAKPIVGKVADIKLEDCGNTEGTKPVLYLEDVERGIVLNATRYTFLTHLIGSANTDDWAGVEIEVRRGQTRFGARR